MSKKRVYIAGPMRGIPAYNFPAFFEAEETLERQGYEVFNPARNDCEKGGLKTDDPEAAGLILQNGLGFGFDLGFDLGDALCDDLVTITTWAEALCLLPGWKESAGVKAELATAEALDMEVFEYERDHVAGYLEQTEVRTVSSTGGEKGVKPERYDLIPKSALDNLGRVYAYGATKYADHNWRRRYEWSKSYSAMMRHLTSFWDGETDDPESGLPHIDHVGFHWAALSTWLREDGEHGEFDDRYREGDPPTDGTAYVGS